MKEVAKDTTTKRLYQECLEEMTAENKNDEQEETEVEDEDMKPIRNIFKMSRVLVDSKAKNKKAKLDGDQLNFTGSNEQDAEENNSDFDESENSQDSGTEVSKTKKKEKKTQKEY